LRVIGDRPRPSPNQHHEARHASHEPRHANHETRGANHEPRHANHEAGRSEPAPRPHKGHSGGQHWWSKPAARRKAHRVA
jgi:hypothetical protein